MTRLEYLKTLNEEQFSNAITYYMFACGCKSDALCRFLQGECGYYTDIDVVVVGAHIDDCWDGYKSLSGASIKNKSCKRLALHEFDTLHQFLKHRCDNRDTYAVVLYKDSVNNLHERIYAYGDYTDRIVE